METEKVQYLPPDAILAEDNFRYSILKPDLEALKSSIVEQGGVLVPVEVEPLSPAQDGKKYRLTTGFRRHKAVSELNKEKSAGLLLPVIVRSLEGDAVTRFRHQLSENVDRESLSPMDEASAIKRALDLGLTTLQVREMFKRPGGRKGNAVQPASNSFINMRLSFLDLPKDIREKIHSGAVGVAAAYELTKAPAEKRAEIIEKAEAARMAALEREEKEEQKFNEAQAKLDAARQEEEATVSKLDAAKAELELAQRALAENEEAVSAAYKTLKKAEKGKDKAAKKAAKEAFAALEADGKGLAKKVDKITKEVESLSKSHSKVAETAAELRAKLEAARKPVGKPKAKAVGAADVKKAAKEAGASSGAVPLTVKDIRKIVDDLALGNEKYPKVSAVGAVLKKCFDGVSTPGQMIKELAGIVGEKTAKK